jgi:phosphoribosylglycinamide formyltransferase-1
VAPQTDRLRVGVLASGTGSNFEAIIGAVDAGNLNVELALLICNRPGARALALADSAGIPTRLIQHGDYPSRDAFDTEMVSALRQADVGLVVMAGFDRLVTPVLLDAYRERVMNIHPALLPSFKGTHGQSQAVDYGVRISGATVHFVDEAVDHGPIIAQAAVAIDPFEATDVSAKRILEQEHRLYPLAIQLFANGQLRIEGRKVRVLDADNTGGALLNPSPPDA